ncbi:SsrA-binding protein SmpB [Pleionea litopenaei]|uniref:SsrA-binding protein n=1 Tax=Pleionea litopenaei TaxID=3070815 RepID=A0AA51X889_9GAMM|nr:SsrA-binding protein SmpB [Pleionea sp. HL-JVS1]WMS89048.1 SsrA-binding protein SmpB [Pleionea sp. HL-JVS1]
MAKKKKTPDNVIVQNKKARHDYFIEDTFEAGLVLEGWEVKSLRASKVNLSDSYIFLKDGEAWLLGCHISPLQTVSSHITPNPTRYRKLLLHNRELAKLFGAHQRQGYTIAALKLYWVKNRVKLEIGLAKGKKLHDKRATEKEREWNRAKQRVLKNA